MDDMVICLHSDCMAGWSEACSHIAIILFTLDANVVVQQDEETSGQVVWCYCWKEECGEMIQCESGRCEKDWFLVLKSVVSQQVNGYVMPAE